MSSGRRPFRSEVDWKTEALNPKGGLNIMALGHTFRGTLLPRDPDNDNELMVSGVFLVISVYMLYAIFLNEGQAQARLAAVIAGPVWVWFVISMGMELENTYTTEPLTGGWTSDFVPPMILWGMTALTGGWGGNAEE
jgi:hypothetical protein